MTLKQKRIGATRDRTRDLAKTTDVNLQSHALPAELLPRSHDLTFIAFAYDDNFSVVFQFHRLKPTEDISAINIDLLPAIHKQLPAVGRGTRKRAAVPLVNHYGKSKTERNKHYGRTRSRLSRLSTQKLSQPFINSSDLLVSSFNFMSHISTELRISFPFYCRVFISQNIKIVLNCTHVCHNDPLNLVLQVICPGREFITGSPLNVGEKRSVC